MWRAEGGRQGLHLQLERQREGGTAVVTLEVNVSSKLQRGVRCEVQRAADCE
jgi:hypothetical protein